MSRRSGQSGHVEVSGRWYVVRFWMDISGQQERRLVREKICPANGPGRLSESERKRKAKEIIAASGADKGNGLEFLLSWFVARRSIQLSYGRLDSVNRETARRRRKQGAKEKNKVSRKRLHVSECTRPD